MAEQVIAGLIRIVRTHQDIVRSSTEWNLVFALLRSTLGNHEAARQAFELMTALVNDGPEQYVTSDNYPGVVAVLDEFMTAASMAVEAQLNEYSISRDTIESRSLEEDCNSPAKILHIEGWS